MDKNSTGPFPIRRDNTPFPCSMDDLCKIRAKIGTSFKIYNGYLIEGARGARRLHFVNNVSDLLICRSIQIKWCGVGEKCGIHAGI